ncbi:MAG: putative MPP superfamily phosphohydrolase [Pseudohongiellaceae bacterium]|jgi:predicted MPP superfamily phosphohydrolase
MTTFYVVAFSVLTTLNVLCCLWLLRRPGPMNLGRIAAVAVLVLLLNGVEILALQAFRLSWFGLAHIAWLDLAVVVPCCALGALYSRWSGRQVSGPAIVVAVAGLAMIPIAVQATFLTPFEVILERVEIPLLARHGGSQPLRIGVLADIQATSIGEHERQAVDRLMAEKPDVILIPGDLYQGPVQQFDEHLPDFQELLQRLHAPGGVWAVRGNAEYQDGLPRLLEGSQIHLLENAVARFTVGDRKVALLGMADWAGLSRQGWQFTPKIVERFAERPPTDEIRLLLCHRPGWVLTLPEESYIDLTVAGHTHGGQVSFPFIGPPLVLSQLPNDICAGGLSEVEGQRLYISRGLGMERLQAPRVRFGVKPEVTLLTLRSPELTVNTADDP